MTRAARIQSGEYVKHMPTGGASQFVVAKYEDMPETLALQSIDMTVQSSGPRLWVLLSEFEVAPKIYRKGAHRGEAFFGSRFVVRGITYQAKNVEPHHRGGAWISLNKDETCVGIDPKFFEELEAFTCSPAPSCG
jgi:hypothetical protein